jgi:hypothetical protein
MKELTQFFKNVIIREGFYDWKLNLVENSSEGYCWHHKKTIDIGALNKHPKELILHEVAHIDTCRFCNQKHNPQFWKRFDELMRKYSKEPESTTSKKHRKYSSEGFYKICYAR